MPASSPSNKLASTTILWFRNDLRLTANPALQAALAQNLPILPIYIWDEVSLGLRGIGGASRWWLDRSLRALSQDLAARGAKLRIFRGGAASVLDAILATDCVQSVFWNRRYDRAETEIDSAIKTSLKARGIDVRSFNSHLLHEPWEVQTKTGDPCKVFTPFWRNARALGTPAIPAPAPAQISSALQTQALPNECELDNLKLHPTRPDWSQGLASNFQPGEAGAKARLEKFLHNGLPGYAQNRDRPDRASTSKLSPHLHFGEISPALIWHSASDALASGRVGASDHDVEKFLAEIGWREFSYHLLHFNPKLATENFQPRFDSFPWKEKESCLSAWQKGQTGYPIVDAGMRELWQTGFMHNRVRMIAASFLIKHLMTDWRKGEAWFWDTLCDADSASNAASWQWVAGSGADAAPYFRIFNPVLQGEKFDTEGRYVAQFVPELARVPAQYIHKPWTAPPDILAKAGVKLGTSYPHPIVDHAMARERALRAFKEMSAA